MNNEDSSGQSGDSVEGTTANEIIDAVSVLEIGARRGSDRLGIIPLRATGSGRREYVTLTEAVSSGHVRVSEISEDGRVSELSVTNTGDRPVLVLDGEELVGAKQNRIVNLTILVPADASLHIPVSCVEAGRWSHGSRDLTPIGRAHYSSGRQMKLEHVSASLRTRLGRRSDQAAIWRGIDEQLEAMGVGSSTSASSAMYEQRSDELSALTREVGAEERDTGAFFLYGERIVSLELCDSPETWRGVLPQLLASYGVDALNARHSAALGWDQVTSPAQFLERVRSAKGKSYEAIGLGADLRLEGDGVCGAALSWNNRIVHLVVFARNHDARVSSEIPDVESAGRRRSRWSIARWARSEET